MAATVRLRIEEFDKLTTQRGWPTDKDRALGLGVSQSLLSRIRSGQTNPGEKFIDACIAKFGALAYDRLFERPAPVAEPVGDAA